MREVLLEREFELDAIEHLLDGLPDRGGVVVVDAPAGMGKTELLRRTRDRAAEREFRVLHARGSDLEVDFAFGVVRQLFEIALPEPGPRLDALFRGAAGLARGLFAGAGPGAQPSIDPATDSRSPGSLHLLLNALYWLLVNLADAAPTVVLVDDMPWVDPPSARFLGFLARRVDSGPIAVVVTSRSGRDFHDESLDELLSLGDVTLLEPRGLQRAGVAEMVRRTLGRPGDDAFCAACLDTTAGNPLFLRELLQIMVADGVRPDASGVPAARAAGPDAVRRRVVTGLRRRPPDVRRTAAAVAVLGDDTDLALVARHCDRPLSDTLAAAEQLAADGLLARTDPPAFVHAVVREVVLAAIPQDEVSAHHDRAAAVLREAGRSGVNVATHLLHTAPRGDPDRVADLLAAAEQTRRRGSPAGAAVFLLRARAEPPPDALRAEVSRLLGNCQAHALALPDAEQYLREALALARTPQQRALCAYSLARFLGACGAPGEAVDLLSAAIDALTAGDGSESPSLTPLTAQLEAERLGVARAALARRPELVTHLAAYRARPDASPAIVDTQRSAEALFAGEPAVVVGDLALRALTEPPLPPDRSGIWVALHTLLVADRLDDADRVLDTALDAAVRRGLAFPTALIRAYQARVAYLRGDLALAEEHLDEGFAGVAAPNGALPVLQATRIQLLVEGGRLTEAVQVLPQSGSADRGSPTTVWQLWLLEARLRLHATRRDAASRYADATTCAALYAQWGAEHLLEIPWRLHVAETLHRGGDPRPAARLVDEHLAMSRAFGVPRYTAAALRTAANLADPPSRALDALHEAVDLLQGSAARLELARTLEQLGTTSLRTDGPRTALPVLERSVNLAAECRAVAMVTRVRDLLVRSGLTARRTRLTGIHAFTPTERNIAQLAARGMTNREIAEHLVLSEKTVEAHLGRAYRKINVRSRTQLAAHLADASVAGRRGLPTRS